jgi:hypothetical protein
MLLSFCHYLAAPGGGLEPGPTTALAVAGGSPVGGGGGTGIGPTTTIFAEFDTVAPYELLTVQTYVPESDTCADGKLIFDAVLYCIPFFVHL